jgi:transposase
MSYLNPALVRNLTPEELLSYVDRSDPVVLRLAELAEYGIDVVEELEEQLASKDEEIEELNEQLARATALCNQYYLGESHV